MISLGKEDAALAALWRRLTGKSASVDAGASITAKASKPDERKKGFMSF
jgi:hypothetical protein